MKHKITYTCSGCGNISLKWVGHCSNCDSWNTFQETQTSSAEVKRSNVKLANLKKLHEIENSVQKRITSGMAEWDRVTGGGIVPGAFMILSGDPGIGKSTLLIQVAHQISSKTGINIIYFCSEESLSQVKSRVSRVIKSESEILFSDTANFETIFKTIESERPDLVIIDSIQNCFFENSDTLPGSISQIKEAGFELMRIAKENNIAIIATGHITKEGVIAGPKTLEHMVDAVFYLQAEDQWNTRILRSVKNRFGAISELGFFSMQEQGLTEVSDINKKLLEEVTHSPGCMLVSHTEGSRPIILELQALAVPSKFGVPQRVITGVDHKRVVIVCAILEKYLQVKLSEHDIFFKVSGGSKVQESSSDLGIALALLSSYFQIPLKEKSLALAEINLTGQIKPVNNINVHINEAERFGINNIFVSSKQVIKNKSSSVMQFNNVYELLNLFI